MGSRLLSAWLGTEPLGELLVQAFRSPVGAEPSGLLRLTSIAPALPPNPSQAPGSALCVVEAFRGSRVPGGRAETFKIVSPTSR